MYLKPISTIPLHRNQINIHLYVMRLTRWRDCLSFCEAARFHAGAMERHERASERASADARNGTGEPRQHCAPAGDVAERTSMNAM